MAGWRIARTEMLAFGDATSGGRVRYPTVALNFFNDGLS
jgi:hypothetical protein